MKHTISRLSALCIIFALTACETLTSQSQVSSCDKVCLFDVTEKFLEAKVKGDITLAPLADNLRTTSNSVEVEFGQGETWQTGITIVNRHTFTDPNTQTAIFFGTIAGAPSDIRKWWHYSLRLSVDANGQIFEVEEQSNSKGFKRADKVESPFREVALFNSVLPKSERVSTEELVAAADAYWDGLTTGDGSQVPFGPNCQRTEFGSFSTNNPYTHDRTGSPDFIPMPKTGKSCRSFFDGPKFRWNTDNRRYYIADEERGVVVGVGQLHKFGEDGIDGLTLMEAFKVVNGRIEWLWAPAFNWAVEESGWPDWERPE